MLLDWPLFLLYVDRSLLSEDVGEAGHSSMVESSAGVLTEHC